MKKYTVWVGATEVNDYYLNKTKAKDLENKYFGIHKVNNLLQGGTIEITDRNLIPSDVMKTLDEIKPKTSKSKKEKK